MYRDAVWTGQDMIGTGVASFSAPERRPLSERAAVGRVPRRYRPRRPPHPPLFRHNREEQLTREVILQLKLGVLDTAYFRAKFGVDIVAHFATALSGLRDEGMLQFDADSVTLTDEGLMRVDQLLPDFYQTQYRNARYT